MVLLFRLTTTTLTTSIKSPSSPLSLSSMRFFSSILSSSPLYSPLHNPNILFSNNHLLVIDKPAGWQSVPNPQPSPKCLLSKLKQMGLGGGSKKDFLIPLHRLDQPCTGVILFAKTKKAASRITTLWKKKRVQKEYLCVVSASKVLDLAKRSTNTNTNNIEIENDGTWNRLQGYMERKTSRKDGSVKVLPNEPTGEGFRPISLEWRNVKLGFSDNNNIRYSLLHIRTDDGARHMVRAMLAQIGTCPIQGDLRYGGTTNNNNVLPDQSVALHARRVRLDSSLQLGSLDIFEFASPIPSTWDSYFGISDEKVYDNHI